MFLVKISCTYLNVANIQKATNNVTRDMLYPTCETIFTIGIYFCKKNHNNKWLIICQLILFFCKYCSRLGILLAIWKIGISI